MNSLAVYGITDWKKSDSLFFIAFRVQFKKKKKEKNFEVILIPIPLYVTWPILGILALKAYGILSSPSLAFSPLSWY